MCGCVCERVRKREIVCVLVCKRESVCVRKGVPPIPNVHSMVYDMLMW